MLRDTSIEVVLKILFLALNNADVEFVGLIKLIKMLFTTTEALSTTKHIEIIDNNDFIKSALNDNLKIFIIYILALQVTKRTIYLLWIASIATLQWDKVFTEVPAKYTDYMHVYLLDLAIELARNISINKYVIELVEEKQLFYGTIDTFTLVELKLLKTYIKTYLKTGFI